jgi:hypothetical protein
MVTIRSAASRQLRLVSCCARELQGAATPLAEEIVEAASDVDEICDASVDAGVFEDADDFLRALEAALAVANEIRDRAADAVCELRVISEDEPAAEVTVTAPVDA